MRDSRGIADKLLAAFNSRNPESVAQLYSPKQVTVLPGMEPIHGREGKAELLSGFYRAFPDLTIGLQLVIVSGNHIVCEGTMTGTHTGPLLSHAGEVPPTGRHMTLPIVYILTVAEDGLIVADRTYFDNATFSAQLGLT